MRRARPYCGENPEPGKDVTESLTPRPELENDQDPKRTLAPNIGQRASRRTMPAAITKAIVALIANSQPYWKIKSDFFVRDHWRASEENNLLGSGILCTVPEFH
jgi:hypothetical protein